MKTSDVVAFFGSQKAVAQSIGVTPSAVCHWGDEVPENRVKSVEMAMQLKQLQEKKQQKKRGKAA